MKRAVRQRCGFGCVLCGNPLITYEHIVDWAEVQEHAADNLTLLCDMHQRQSTGGLLSRSQVLAADRDPYCLRHGATSPFGLNFGPGAGDPRIMIGGNLFTHPHQVTPIVIDYYVPISFHTEGSALLLNVQLLDRENRTQLMIRKNELVFRADNWDVQLVGNHITVNSAPGDIQLRMFFEPPDMVRIERAKIYGNGIMVDVVPSQLVFKSPHTNAVVKGEGNLYHIPFGYVIGESPYRPAGHQLDLPRYPSQEQATSTTEG